MRTETINIYTIEEHPNPDACFEWIRDNWHDLGEWAVDEMVASLKALAKYTGGTLGYCISIEPDYSEYVKLVDYDPERLAELYAQKDDCPLTGVCYDINVIEGLQNNELESVVLKILHNEGEYIYSDEGLRELCEANEYEFTENGDFVK